MQLSAHPLWDKQPPKGTTVLAVVSEMLNPDDFNIGSNGGHVIEAGERITAVLKYDGPDNWIRADDVGNDTPLRDSDVMMWAPMPDLVSTVATVDRDIRTGPPVDHLGDICSDFDGFDSRQFLPRSSDDVIFRTDRSFIFRGRRLGKDDWMGGGPNGNMTRWGGDSTVVRWWDLERGSYTDDWAFPELMGASRDFAMDQDADFTEDHRYRYRLVLADHAARRLRDWVLDGTYVGNRSFQLTSGKKVKLNDKDTLITYRYCINELDTFLKEINKKKSKSSSDTK